MSNTPESPDIPQQFPAEDTKRERINWRGKQLVSLAKERFSSTLSELEQAILIRVGTGKAPDCEDKKVDADFFVWLCTDEKAREFVPHTGIILYRATFTASIELHFAVIPFPLALFKCHLQQDVVLLHARLHSLFLNESECKSIRADGLTTQGDLNLSNVTLENEIRLLGASIGGSVFCNDANITAPKHGDNQGKAFSADRLTTKGNVIFSAARVNGVIRLLNANIGGNLDCEGANITAPTHGVDHGRAVNADGLTTKGNILFESAEVNGTIRLLNANIGGVIYCTGANITAPELGDDQGNVIGADGLTTTGDILFRKAKVNGAIRLLNANIGGSVDCEDANITAPKHGTDQGRTFSADGITVHGNMYLRNGFTAKGQISLVRATIHGGLCLTNIKKPEQTILDLNQAHANFLFDDTSSWPTKGNLHLDGFTYDSIFDGSPSDFASRKDWLSRMPDDQFRPQPYEQLAKVLRAAGHEADAKAIRMEKHRAYARALSWTRQPHFKLWSIFLKWTTGYGYSPLRTFGWMLGFIFFGTLIFSQANNAGLMAKFQESSIKHDNTAAATFASDPYPEFSSLFFSLDAFVPLVDLHQETYWMPNVEKGDVYNVPVLPMTMKSGGWIRLYLWLHILSGWILTSLFVVGLTGMMRKDE